MKADATEDERLKLTVSRRFEVRACAACGQMVAHRLVDGEPHARHIVGARHRRAVEAKSPRADGSSPR